MIEPPRLSLRNSLWHLIEECKNMRELKQIHAQILVSPYLPKHDRYFLITRLLFFSAISESGCLNSATEIFHRIENPNLFVYNTMIRTHACKINGAIESSSYRSLILYKQMLREGVRPDHLTFPFLVKECTRRLNLELGTSVHAYIIKIRFDEDRFVQNSLINMYATCGYLNCAQRVLNEMSNQDVVSWNSLLIGCLRCGALDSALDLFKTMTTRNVITWNSIITGFVQGGRPIEALDFFHEMQVSGDDTTRPDKITIASVLSACASLGALDQGKWVHSFLKRNEVECDLVIGTALVDLYGKCGCVERAVDVFKEMQSKDVFAWTAMISVFALHGLGKEAFDLLKEMETKGVKPNHVTFVALLSACAHSGLVEKGRWCFDVMKHIYSIKPLAQHYACMVDILGRAGLFDEAEGLIKSMSMEPDVFVWGALLGSCRMHGNVELGERVACYLIELEPMNHAFYVILSDIYAKANRFDNVKRIRIFMEERGVKKTVPGCSMLEINGVVHEFSVRGSSEATMKEIEWILSGVGDEMKIAGDTPNVNNGLIETET